MELEEAKTYLEQIGLVVNLPVHNDIRLAGGSRHELIGAEEFKVKIVIDPFHIIYYEQTWIVEIAANWTIISVSQQLQDVVYAIENFFKLSERNHEKFYEIGLALRELPPREIVALVDSNLANPGIRAAVTPPTRNENYFTFMLETPT